VAWRSPLTLGTADENVCVTTLCNSEYTELRPTLLHPSVQVTTSDLVHVDLGSQKAWTLRNANQSISLPATVPAHALSVLASAGVIAQDPLYR
jgi:hypothetical protein